MQCVIAAATIALCGANSDESVASSGDFNLTSEDFDIDSLSFSMPSGSFDDIVSQASACTEDFEDKFGEMPPQDEADERFCEVESCVEFLNTAKESGLPTTEEGERQLEMCGLASVQAMVSTWALAFALCIAMYA